MFHKNLKEQRLKRGVSQKQVAEYLNISPQSVSKWEKGEALPSIEFLPKLSEILQCEINDFFVKVKAEMIDCQLLNSYFEIFNQDGNDDLHTDLVANFLLEHPDFTDKAMAFFNKIKEYKQLNRAIIKDLLDCSDTMAKELLRHLEKSEMVACLDEDSFLVMKGSVDGFKTLIRVGQRLCEVYIEKGVISQKTK